MPWNPSEYTPKGLNLEGPGQRLEGHLPSGEVRSEKASGRGTREAAILILRVKAWEKRGAVFQAEQTALSKGLMGPGACERLADCTFDS